ncbi:MAG: hypothetical protein NC452_20985 [Eubacterium sp.]|nr:hypothetical protein [Eubacterium sp.]
MTNKLPDKIADMLMEKDYRVIEDGLKDILGSNFKTELILFGIFVEQADKPTDRPFCYAISMLENNNIENIKSLLKDLLKYQIDEINKAKIYDFFWNLNTDCLYAQSAETHYYNHLKTTNQFDLNYMAINRIVDISKKINSKNIDVTIRKELIVRVLNQYDNEDCFKIVNLIQTAIIENVDVDYLTQYTEKLLNKYDDQSDDYYDIGLLCDELEQLYYKEIWLSL